MSTLQERRELRQLTATAPNQDADQAPVRQNTKWVDFAAGNALSLAAILALVWLATIGLVVVNYFNPVNLVPLVYMLPVVIAATQWGLVAGIVAAVAGAAAADFFFYPPLYTFWIRDPQDMVDLVLFLLVALVTSNLAVRLKNQAETTSRREKEIRELHAFSQGLATCLTSRDLIFAVQDYLSNTLGYRAVLIASAHDDLSVAGDTAAVPSAVRDAAAKLMATKPLQASTICQLPNHCVWLIRVIKPEILGYGAIAIELRDGASERTDAVARRVEALLEEATATLKHLKVKESIEQATIDYRTEVLSDALIAGVSHELRTPLTSILGSCSVLGQTPAIVNDSQARALVEAIHDQAGQLDNEIRDLLDATRISAKGLQPQLTWTDPTDIVGAAIKQKARRLAAHWVTLDLQRDVPLVHVDSVLVEQALGQLLENAAKYSPTGTTITIASRRQDDHVVLSVSDQGSGLTAEEKEQLGKRSFRGRRQSAGAAGSGLGLWIATSFIAANGGTLVAESPGPDRGTTISLKLPAMSGDTQELADAIDD